jgi:hypothetical protein
LMKNSHLVKGNFSSFEVMFAWLIEGNVWAVGGGSWMVLGLKWGLTAHTAAWCGFWVLQMGKPIV